MADIKKFLNQDGVSVLWSRIAEEVKKVDDKAVVNAGEIAKHETRLAAAEGKIEALEKGTYDDTEVRGLISTNAQGIADNKAAIETLNGDAETAGSVANTATSVAAAKVAEIVAGANADFDTLKEIADWILNDTTGAADMANDIAALQAQMAGIESTVVAKIAAEIEAALKADGADKYALASDLVALAERVKAIEDAGYQNAEQVGSAIDAKIAALDLANKYDAKGAAAAAETAAKAYADGLAVNYDAKGSAATAESNAKAYADGLVANCDVKGAAAAAEAAAKSHSDANLVTAKAYSDANLVTAKAYTDTEVAKIQALTEAEIDAAIAAATAKA